MYPEVSVLIPTYRRAIALSVTLTGLYYQSDRSFDITIADQSPDDELLQDASVDTVISMLRQRGVEVRVLKNLPRRGMAQQRQFLLEHARAPLSLFLDDDLVLESYVIANMKRVLREQECGFVGCAPIGLSYREDYRPVQQHIEFWEGRVEPEVILPGSDQWQRYRLHNAANVLHVEQRYGAVPEKPMPYKIAWVGGCVLYDTRKLRELGGYGFWEQLPEAHCGEDVLAQLRVMRRYGGCAILPSGVYHQERETTVPDRRVNAPEYLEI